MKINDLWFVLNKETQYKVLILENNKVLIKGKYFQKEIWNKGLLDLNIDNIEIKNNILNIYIQQEDYDIILEDYKARNDWNREENLEYIIQNWKSKGK